MFDFNWRNFQQLDATFIDKPQDGFTVVLDKQFFGVKGLAQTDTTKLNDFLDRISLLTVDEYLPATSSTDSLFAGKAIIQVTVKDIASRAYTLQLFPFDKARNQFPGLINGNERVLFAVGKIKEILRSKRYFQPKSQVNGD